MIVRHQRQSMFKCRRGDHHVCQRDRLPSPRPCALQGTGSACNRASHGVTVEAGKKGLSFDLFSCPHAGIHLSYIEGCSRENVAAGDQFCQQSPPVLTYPKHIDQDRSIEQKNHFAGFRGLTFGIRFSPSARRRFTHAPDPEANSACSLPRHAG